MEETGEDYSRAGLVNKERLGLLCYDYYFMAQQLFGPVFLRLPIERYYTSISDEVPIYGVDEGTEVQIEFITEVDLDAEAVTPKPSRYTLTFSTSESMIDSKFEGFYLTTQRTYEVDPDSLAVKISVNTSITNEDGSIIMDLAEPCVENVAIATEPPSKKELKGFRGMVRGFRNSLDEDQLRQIQDCQRALGYAEYQD